MFILIFYGLAFYVTLSRWPNLREKLQLFIVLGVLGYVLARTYIHILTGVDPSNFNTTVLLFTTGFIVLLQALPHGIIGGITGLCVLARGLWRWLMVRETRWPYVRVQWEERWEDIGIGLCMVFIALGLWKNSCFAVIQRQTDIVARLVLVRYEFSYDPTCAVSSETPWVAPLKDRKELKISNVLIAEYQAWDNIHFVLGQCEKAPSDQNW